MICVRWLVGLMLAVAFAAITAAMVSEAHYVLFVIGLSSATVALIMSTVLWIGRFDRPAYPDNALVKQVTDLAQRVSHLEAMREAEAADRHSSHLVDAVLNGIFSVEETRHE